MESLWKHSSPLHAGEFFHGAFEAVDDTAAVFALLGLGKTRALEERAVKFLQRKTGKLTVLDAAALDLEAYPGWLRAPVSALVLNRLAALYCDEMSYAMGHPYFLAPVHGGGKILMKLLGIGDNVLDDYRWRQELYPGATASMCPCWPAATTEAQQPISACWPMTARAAFFASALREEGVDISRVRVMHGISARNYIELDEAGDRHFVGNNGRETAQYQALLCLTPGDYAMMEQYDLAHTSIRSWLDAYHQPSAAGCRSLWTFPAVRPGEHPPALRCCGLRFPAAPRRRCGRWPPLRWTPERARSW